MSKREAEQFEEALQRADRGELVGGQMAGLVEVARTAAALAGPHPPPPHNLAPGRQRFLAEAARLRARETGWRFGITRGTAMIRLAGALLAVILLVGALAGTGLVAAGSLPGAPLYSVKLAAERARIGLTTNPEAKASLNLEVAEARLAEVTALMEQGQAVDDPTVTRATEQLEAALDSAYALKAPLAPHWLGELAITLQQRQRTMEAAAGDRPAPPVQELLREMERVRQEAHAGTGEPEGEQNHLRHGTPPPEPTGVPQPTQRITPGHTGKPGEQRQHGPSAEPDPGATPTCTPTTPPPGTPSGPRPKPTQTPGPSCTPGPDPSQAPGGGPGHDSPPPQGGDPPPGGGKNEDGDKMP